MALSIRPGTRLKYVLLMTALSAMLAACSDSNDSDDPVNLSDGADTPAYRVMTAQGSVQGVEEERQVSFKGIPYAAAPTGERRFAPPAPAANRDAVLQADSFGSPCPQGGGTFGQPSENEDCLFLNVYTPKDGDDHPVMVWVHGGAFVTGSGGTNYNPVRLVEEDTVVVTINYRLGALGFLAHPQLTAEASNEGSGDYGLLDQQAALQWVQDNIENFGGDPDNVTLFGESAGGHSVLSQLASPTAEDLFDRAIVQSGAYTPNQLTLAQAEALGTGVAQALGCDSLDCLRNASVADIIAAQQAFSFIPNVRPDVLPNSIADAIETAQFNQVPVVIGTNRDEGQLFVAIDELTRQAALEEDDYRSEVAALIGATPDDNRVDNVIAEYPVSEYDDTAHALAAAYTDYRFACDSLAQSRALAPTVNTYTYAFADRGAPSLLPPSPSFQDYGAAHAFEIAYVLNTEAVMRERGAGEAQIALSDAMIDYWTTFARSGNPNPDDGTRVFWPQFTSADDAEFLELVAPTPQTLGVDAFGERHHCGFWLDADGTVNPN